MLEVYDPNGLTKIIGLPCKRSTVPLDNLNFLHKDGFVPQQIDHVLFWYQEPILLEDSPFWNKTFRDQEPDHFIFASKEEFSTKSRAFCAIHLLWTIRGKQKIPPTIQLRSNKPYIADVLLGQPKPHRWIIFDELQKHNLLDSCLVSLKKGSADLNFERKSPAYYESSDLLSFEDESIKKYKLEQPVNFFDSCTILGNNQIWISQMLPHKIYDNSFVSIVAETLWYDSVFFPTEKIGKCLLAGRIFLVSSSRHFLKNLRALGFETFSDVIDESYDDVKDDDARTHAMMESFAQLAKEDLDKVYQKVIPILQHNQSLMTKEYLGREARDFIYKIAG